MADPFHRDARLLRGVLSGRVEAWQQLVTRFAPYLLAAIGRYSRDYDERMTIFLEVLERLRQDDFARLRGFAYRSSLATWLTVVARRTALDVLRSRYGRDFRFKELREISLDDSPEALRRLADPRTPEEEMRHRERGERRRRLQSSLSGALSRLPPDDAMLVRAVYFEGMRIGDAGQALGVRAVYKRLRSVLGRLRRELEHTPEGDAALLDDLMQGEIS